MKINVPMPQLGESVAEGKVTVWLKQPGDAVERDESIAEVETDKATVEIPAPASGTLAEVLVAAGETVEVGVNIATIEASGDQAATSVEMVGSAPRAVQPTMTIEQAAEPKQPAEAEEAAAPPKPQVKPRPATGALMTPLARRLVREFGLDPEAIEGTGADGRVTRADVMKAKEEADQAPPEPEATAESEPEESSGEPAGKTETPKVQVGDDDEAVAVTPLRRRIAQRLTRSWQTVPHVTTVAEVDMTPVADLRKEHKEAWAKDGLKLTYTPFFMKATVEALKAFPAINSSWAGDTIVRHKRVHLAMAVATDAGLTVPVIRDADDLSLRDLAARLAEVAEHARAGKLTPAELEGSTFTITNPGMFGAVLSTPIISPPNAAILGIERIAETPVAHDGRISIRLMCFLCLSYDHRVVDGETAIKFLQHMRHTLEAAEFEMGG